MGFCDRTRRLTARFRGKFFISPKFPFSRTHLCLQSSDYHPICGGTLQDHSLCFPHRREGVTMPRSRSAFLTMLIHAAISSCLPFPLGWQSPSNLNFHIPSTSCGNSRLVCQRLKPECKPRSRLDWYLQQQRRSLRILQRHPLHTLHATGREQRIHSKRLPASRPSSADDPANHAAIKFKRNADLLQRDKFRQR